MHYIQAKSILSAHNGMNLYRGCTHGCIYCDSRSECYAMDHPFEDIAVKENAIELLRDALSRKRHPCMIGTGSMCDPYLPLEEDLCLTRKALEVIDEYRCGVTVLTKSNRILRDIDLYEQINRHSKAVVQMTLTTYDEALCKWIEPNVSVTRERIAVLKECQARGIPTVVWLTPILPFINDTEENLNALLDACFDAGVRGIVQFGIGVTLRAGDREYFYRALDRHFPGIKEKYVQTFGNAYECPSPKSAELRNLILSRCREHGVEANPKRVFAYLSEYPSQSDQLSFFE